MVINHDVLVRFDACSSQIVAFLAEFPNGLDVSGLWGDSDERAATWLRILSSEVSFTNLGWAIMVGIIPGRITANLTRANLSEADLRKADLFGANLSGAMWNQYTRWPDGFAPPNN